MNLMMLAAGEGTRLRPHTLHTPKPAMPFLNVPLAAWSLTFLGDIKVSKMCVNTFHLPSKVHQLFKSIHLPTQDLHFSDESGKILGSGGGLEKAREHFENQGDLILKNSDEVILPENRSALTDAHSFHKKNKALATLIVTEHPEVGSKFGGVWIDSANKVIGFGKQKPEGAVKGWHFVGIQILSDQVFNFLPINQESNILYDALTLAIKADHLVQVFPINCLWFETGNQHDFLQASKQCLEILTQSESSIEAKYISEVITKHCGDQWQVETGPNYTALIAKSAKISLDAILEGFCVIGPDVSISSKIAIKDSVLIGSMGINERSKIENEILF